MILGLNLHSSSLVRKGLHSMGKNSRKIVWWSRVNERRFVQSRKGMNALFLVCISWRECKYELHIYIERDLLVQCAGTSG